MAKQGGKFAIHTLNYLLYTVIGIGPVLVYAYFSGPSKEEVETGLVSIGILSGDDRIIHSFGFIAR